MAKSKRSQQRKQEAKQRRKKKKKAATIPGGGSGGGQSSSDGSSYGGGGVLSGMRGFVKGLGDEGGFFTRKRRLSEYALWAATLVALYLLYRKFFG